MAKEKSTTLSSDDIRIEQWDFYSQVLSSLSKEEDELYEHLKISRNLACSEWSRDFCGRRCPNKTLHETTSLLIKNFDEEREAISRKRFYLIELFRPLLEEWGHQFTDKEADCFNYWNPLIGKSKKPKRKK